jgi:hypothetical protein
MLPVRRLFFFFVFSLLWLSSPFLLAIILLRSLAAPPSSIPLSRFLADRLSQTCPRTVRQRRNQDQDRDREQQRVREKACLPKMQRDFVAETTYVLP